MMDDDIPFISADVIAYPFPDPHSGLATLC